jgi:hypothetical protein
MLSSDEVAKPVHRPKERSVRVQAYVGESFQEQLARIGRLWTLIDKAADEVKNAGAGEKKEPLKEWTESEVVKRLLESGLESAWEEIGGGEPKTHEEWAELESKYVAALTAAASKKKR